MLKILCWVGWHKYEPTVIPFVFVCSRCHDRDSNRW